MPTVFPRDPLTEQIIGAAIEVHKGLGPCLSENSYEEAMGFELDDRGVLFQRQVRQPVIYKSRRLRTSYRIDLVIEREVVVELKAVEKLIPVHSAQVISYLRVSGLHTGLLINFNEAVLKDGIKRISL